MCYSMYEKRSDAAKKGVDAKSSADKATMTADAATARSASQGKAYSSFRARLQRWIAKEDKKQEETVS